MEMFSLFTFVLLNIQMDSMAYLNYRGTEKCIFSFILFFFFEKKEKKFGKGKFELRNHSGKRGYCFDYAVS